MRLLFLSLAAFMALATVGMAQTGKPMPTVAVVEPSNAALLAPFHRALAELEAGHLQRVVVLQIGAREIAKPLRQCWPRPHADCLLIS